MKIEGGRISGLELACLVICFNFGSSLILNPGQSLERDAWLAVLAGLAEGLVFVWIAVTLMSRFPGQTLGEINDLLFGRYVGKLITLLYFWYFFHLASIVLRDYGDFFTTIIYKETSLIVILILLLFICAWAVRHGLEVLARCSTVLLPLVILAIIFDTVLLLKEMEFGRFFPILDVSWAEFLRVSHSVATFPFGETIAFLLILPFSTAGKNTKKVVQLALIGAGVILALVVARNALSLGMAVVNQTYPSYPAIRLINIADFLTRLEIIITANLLAMGFMKVCVLYYGTVLGLAQLLRLGSYVPLVWPIGALLVSLSSVVFESNIENLVFTREIYPYYSLIFQLVLPLLSLLIAVIRGLPKEKVKGQ